MKTERVLVDDWNACWRWASMRWSLAGISCNILAACLVKGITVSVAFLGYLPLAWLPLVAVAIGVIAMIGRVTKTVPKVEHPDVPWWE